MTNTTDITNLTDAALDVVLAVKSGEDCVEVEHLSPAERLSVCNALGVEVGSRMAHWLVGSASTPAVTNARRGHGRDIEGAILDRQEDEIEGAIPAGYRGHRSVR